MKSLDIEIEINGLDDMVKAIETMPQAASVSVIRAIHREAAKPILKEVRKNSPTEEIARGVKLKTSRRDKTKIRVALTHPLSHIFNWGTVRRETSKGYNRGRMGKVREYIERSAKMAERDALTVLDGSYVEMFDKHLKKYIKRLIKRVTK